MRQATLFKNEKDSKVNEVIRELPFKRIRDESFDFKDTPASTGIYAIHPYPAMFHFLVVRELIKRFYKEDDYILDPFMSSGVVAGECIISRRNFIRYDLNPLAVLISKVRTMPIKCSVLLETLESISEKFKHHKPENVEFPNIHYWFDDDVVENLSKLRQAIFMLQNDDIRDFFKIAFSETVRKVLKTRYNEFKLLRKKEGNSNSDVLFDKTSLGAKPKEIHLGLPSEILYKYIEKIADKDEKRAKEVFSFYSDLHTCIQVIAKKVKKNGYVCFVVGNRKVKGIELPTDKISADFFEHEGFEHQKTIIRAISNKRMPTENAPSNIKGQKDYTMRYKYIVILKKI